MTRLQRFGGFYFVTDAGLSRAGNASDVRSAIAAGATAVQYRAKERSARDMYHEATALRALCGATPFIVNDRVDLALAVRADGVHLGQDDVPCAVARRLVGDAAIVGVSVRCAAEAREAERTGADYVAVSPVFSTRTKRDAAAACGLEVVRQVREAVAIPVVGIGGRPRSARPRWRPRSAGSRRCSRRGNAPAIGADGSGTGQPRRRDLDLAFTVLATDCRGAVRAPAWRRFCQPLRAALESSACEALVRRSRSSARSVASLLFRDGARGLRFSWPTS